MNLQAQQRNLANLWHRFLPNLAVALLLGSTAMRAQRIGVTYNAEAQTDTALERLSPASQAVMAKLSRLDKLPMGDLRYYAGNLPNGGAVDLDDSSWQTIQVPFTASADAIWLRKWIEVPKTLDGYDLTGAKIWLLQPSSGGLSVFLNGQPVAKGVDMEPIVLFGAAKPGAKLLLAIRLDKTASPKRLRRMELRIDFAPNRPNPRVLHEKFLSAAILSLAPDKLSAVDQSIASVDIKALDAGNQEAFDASLNKA
jgi:alpha-mannosidase